MNNNERQFIFTNEDDEMEILANDEINDYVNKKIDLGKRCVIIMINRLLIQFLLKS